MIYETLELKTALKSSQMCHSGFSQQ